MYVYLDTISNWKLCSLQVAFLSSKFYVNAGVPISFTNSIDINVSSIGTKTWVPCSISYTASGGEKYIIIGNMKNDAQLTCKTKFTTIAFNESYYHIDNLSLIQTTVNLLNEIDENGALLQVFPNPTNDNLNISSVQGISEISISNSLGQIIRQQDLDSKNNQTILQTTDLSCGLYQIHFKTSFGTVTKKFVKTN
jgi:hypothetical protein